jgi:hydroxymethylglutaryl-CoA reductase
VEEQVGGGLAVGDLVAAEDAALEPLVEAGVAEGEAELVVAAAGGDAGRGRDLVERLLDAVHRTSSAANASR